MYTIFYKMFCRTFGEEWNFNGFDFLDRKNMNEYNGNELAKIQRKEQVLNFMIDEQRRTVCKTSEEKPTD